MTIKRIKYVDHKYKDDHKITGKFYTSKSTGANYRIILNLEKPEAMEYYIRNERSGEYVYKSGQYTNLNVLKRKAREEIERFGVPLNKESRNRTFGLCSVGTTQDKWEQEEFFNKEEKE